METCLKFFLKHLITILFGQKPTEKFTFSIIQNLRWSEQQEKNLKIRKSQESNVKGMARDQLD